MIPAGRIEVHFFTINDEEYLDYVAVHQGGRHRVKRFRPVVRYLVTGPMVQLTEVPRLEEEDDD